MPDPVTRPLATAAPIWRVVHAWQALDAAVDEDEAVAAWAPFARAMDALMIEWAAYRDEAQR